LLVRFDFCHNSKYSILRAFARGLALGATHYALLPASFV
jgi:hypothetical protein